MTDIQINDAELHRLMHDRSGPVFRLVEATTHAVEEEMRRTAPIKRFPNQDGPGGRLRQSVRSEVIETISGVEGRIHAGYESRGHNVALLNDRGRSGYTVRRRGGVVIVGQRDGAHLGFSPGQRIGGVSGTGWMEQSLATATAASPNEWHVSINSAPFPFILG